MCIGFTRYCRSSLLCEIAPFYFPMCYFIKVYLFLTLAEVVFVLGKVAIQHRETLDTESLVKQYCLAWICKAKMQ